MNCSGLTGRVKCRLCLWPEGGSRESKQICSGKNLKYLSMLRIILYVKILLNDLLCCTLAIKKGCLCTVTELDFCLLQLRPLRVKLIRSQTWTQKG